MRQFIKTTFALLAVFLISAAIAVPTGLPFFPVVGAVTVSSMIIPTNPSHAYVGLNKEIWLDVLMENFFPDTSWLSELRDFDAFVENDIIHIAEAGILPEILVNNNIWPIPVTERVDSDNELILDNYDSVNTRVRNVDVIELAYNKLESVIYGHKKQLLTKFMERAAHAIAPVNDTEFTPIIPTTGAASGGLKRLTFDDLDEISTRFDEAEIPAEGRVLLLTPTHLKDLRAEDRKAYKDMMQDKAYASFKVYTLAGKRMPHYNKNTGAKVAVYGAALTANDKPASIVFHKDECFRALGTEKMYWSKSENDPANRADTIGFAIRGLAGPIRNVGIGAIYSAASA